MKFSKKYRVLALALLAVLLFAAGCSSAKRKTAESAPRAPQAAPAPMPETPAEDRGEAGGGWDNSMTEEVKGDIKPDYGGHKIIRTAGLGLETREFDRDLAYIKQKVVDMGGYVSDSYVSGRKPVNYNDPGRYAGISIRIPQQRMEAFLADARGIATVTFENSGGQDITSAYFDTDSRLEIYKTQRERIMLLLDKAENMEDIISLETELSRLTYEIEGLTTQLKRWDDLVDFATVSIDLNEIPPAVAIASNDDFGTRVNEGLKETLSAIAVFGENLLVFIIIISPVLGVLLVIGVIVFFIVRRSRKKLREKMANMKQQAPPQQYAGGYGSAPLPPMEQPRQDDQKKSE